MPVVSSWYRDLQGLLGLGFHGVEETLALIEESEAALVAAMTPPWLPGAAVPARLSRILWRLARAGNQALGQGFMRGMDLLPAPGDAAAGSRGQPFRDLTVSALNGVIGDQLEALGNPLAIPMHLRHKGRLLRPGSGTAPEGASDHILLMVHGLCMADVVWHRYGHHHGRHLAAATGVTPVSVVYNTGRHVSANGAALAALVGRLIDAWPVPVRRLSFLGYSMGGVVTRAALEAARRAGANWLGLGGHVLYLGAPHHGAPLEQGGHALQAMAEMNPVLAPLGRLARVRSAGITDLRHGNIVEEDWRGRGRFQRGAGRDRRPVPLDPAFRHHAVAGTLGLRPGDATDRLLGDGLVPIDSALGRHADPAYDFALPPGDRLVLPATGHLDLLSSLPAAEAMAKWLKA